MSAGKATTAARARAVPRRMLVLAIVLIVAGAVVAVTTILSNQENRTQNVYRPLLVNVTPAEPWPDVTMTGSEGLFDFTVDVFNPTVNPTLSVIPHINLTSPTPCAAVTSISEITPVPLPSYEVCTGGSAPRPFDGSPQTIAPGGTATWTFEIRYTDIGTYDWAITATGTA